MNPDSNRGDTNGGGRSVIDSTIGQVVRLPVSGASATSTALSRAAASVGKQVTRLTEEPGGVVDDWGRDPALVRAMIALSHLRWNVSVGGDQHLPKRRGALICVNARPYAQATVFAAFSISEAVDRPVRFVGRPDTAPVGSFARRLGALLEEPDEIAGALAADELVVMSAAAATGGRSVGIVDHFLVGAALATNTKVFPAATTSRPMSREARVEIGRPSKARRERRGPLAELELADHVREDIHLLLDELGNIETGTPLDWLPLSGFGGR